VEYLEVVVPGKRSRSWLIIDRSASQDKVLDHRERPAQDFCFAKAMSGHIVTQLSNVEAEAC